MTKAQTLFRIYYSTFKNLIITGNEYGKIFQASPSSNTYENIAIVRNKAKFKSYFARLYIIVPKKPRRIKP